MGTVAACETIGFHYITGHGVTPAELAAYNFLIVGPLLHHVFTTNRRRTLVDCG